jgi:hypothetical protein
MTNEQLDELVEKYRLQFVRALRLGEVNFEDFSNFKKYRIYFLLSSAFFLITILTLSKHLVFFQWRLLPTDFRVLKVMDRVTREILKF